MGGDPSDRGGGAGVKKTKIRWATDFIGDADGGANQHHCAVFWVGVHAVRNPRPALVVELMGPYGERWKGVARVG